MFVNIYFDSKCIDETYSNKSQLYQFTIKCSKKSDNKCKYSINSIISNQHYDCLCVVLLNIVELKTNIINKENFIFESYELEKVIDIINCVNCVMIKLQQFINIIEFKRNIDVIINSIIRFYNTNSLYFDFNKYIIHVDFLSSFNSNN